MFVFKVKHQGKHISEDATSILFVCLFARENQQQLPLHFREGNKLREPFHWTAGLPVKMQGGSSRSCPFPDPQACKSSLDFWRFHRQNCFAPPLATLLHTLIREMSSSITTHLHCAYVCMLFVFTYGIARLGGIRTTMR